MSPCQSPGLRLLIAVIRRELPGLLPSEIDESAAATTGVGEVLTALLGVLPPELRAAIEQKAAALKERLEDEIRAGSKTAPLMLLGHADTEGGLH